MSDPAFPIALIDKPALRDYFAAAALTGYRCAYHLWCQRVSKEDFADPAKFAEWAYRDADAMLKERAK